MRPILLLIFLISFLSTSVGAANFACRDSKGKLYFTDNPYDVPEDCRQNLQQIEQRSNSVGNVPSPATKEESVSPPASPKNQAVQKETNDEQAAQLQRQAAEAVKKYTQGVETLDKASKRRRFGSNARFAETQRMVDEGNKMIDEARQEKERLLTELESQKISAQQRAEIEGLLESVR